MMIKSLEDVVYLGTVTASSCTASHLSATVYRPSIAHTEQCKSQPIPDRVHQ